MIRAKTLLVGLAAATALIAGAAWAQVLGIGEGSGSSRLEACRAAMQDASRDSEFAARSAQRNVDSRTLVSAEVSPCDCEEDKSPTASSYQRWKCIAAWRLVGSSPRAN